ncbi:MAG: hypothetical protein L0H93_23290 [Nocardioides sp.]|nr:hypothetical protein [Nocardioides sp.]
MRVIGAGWGRTGTTSAAAALELLGFGPCLQMQDVWPRPELASLWNRHRAGHLADWRQELREFDSCVDWPGCWQWREFAELWPEAHVLLTVRDAESWYDSALGSIHAWTAPGQDVGPPEVAGLLDAVWEEHFGGWQNFLDRPRAVAAYEEHLADVRKNCPGHRLIEWRVSDGWEPLCSSLGVPVPDVSLPHLNARESS